MVTIERFVQHSLGALDTKTVFDYDGSTVEFRLEPLVQFHGNEDSSSEYRYSRVSQCYSMDMSYWTRSCVLSLMRALLDRPKGRCAVTKDHIEIL